jgi:hypothetical protein
MLTREADELETLERIWNFIFLAGFSATQREQPLLSKNGRYKVLFFLLCSSDLRGLYGISTK